MLPQVIGDNEALGRGGLDENSLEVDLLRPSIDLLQLLTGQLNTAVSDFRLSLGLSFPLSFHDSVLVGFPSMSETGEIRLRRLIAVDWLFHIQEIDMGWHLKSRGRHLRVHAKVWVFFDFLKRLWRQSASRLEPLLDFGISLAVLALLFEEITSLLLVVLNLHELFYCGYVATSESCLDAVRVRQRRRTTYRPSLRQGSRVDFVLTE
jgi:hypothetical protein